VGTKKNGMPVSVDHARSEPDSGLKEGPGRSPLSNLDAGRTQTKQGKSYIPRVAKKKKRGDYVAGRARARREPGDGSARKSPELRHGEGRADVIGGWGRIGG